MDKIEFDSAVIFMKKQGFDVKVTHKANHSGRSSFWFAEVGGSGIRGGFCDSDCEDYPRLSGKFVADNSKCFDKWSACPLSVKFPDALKNEKQFLGWLKFLGSKEGYKHSNSHEYLHNPVMPLE